MENTQPCEVMNAKQRYVTVLMLSNEKEIQKFTASVTTKGEKHISKDQKAVLPNYKSRQRRIVNDFFSIF